MATIKAKLEKASTFHKSVKALSDIVKEVNFEFTEEGIRVQAMDPVHVAIVLLVLSSEGFDSYECSQNTTIGLKLKDVLDALKCASNDDPMYIEYNDDTPKILFKFEGKGQISEFSINIIDLEEEGLSIPDMEYAAKIDMESSRFQRICKDLKVWGELVQITALKSGVVVLQTNGENGSAKIKLPGEDGADEEGVKIEVSDEVEGSFGVNYLNYFTKATPLSERVEIGLSNGIPLSVTYKMEKKLGQMVFHLAPSSKE